MRYVIIGAGAIGATIGGRLAETGRDVVLVARGEHARVLKSDGLRLALPEREIHLHLPTVTIDELALQAGDVLVLAVKSQHSEGLLGTLAGIAGDLSLPLFCAQNGMSNEDIALRYFADVHGICLNLPATHLQPGRVVAEGAPLSGVLQLGRYPTGTDDVDAAVCADLNDSGFAATARGDVMSWKRTKLLGNLGNALEVLCAGDAEDVRERARTEGLACFAAAGMAVEPAAIFSAEARRIHPVPVGGRAREGGSTWQSVQRGQDSVETDFLNGDIVRLGRLHQIPTPVNAAIQARMRAVNGGLVRPVDPSELLA